MNVIKKYWDSVHIYILLLIPSFCIIAGIFWTVCKTLGLYPDLSWGKIGIFDFSQVIYLGIALYLILKNRRDSSYIVRHLFYIKCFILFLLFVQYNFILALFPSVYVWECTFLFLAVVVFFFDSRMMAVNIFSYLISLLAAHLFKPELFLPLDAPNLEEIIAFRVVILLLTIICILMIVYFVESFLIRARESNEENIYLLEKQLEYYKKTEYLDTELRKFRHDIRNHFLCMETLLNSDKKEELYRYFEDLSQSFSFQEKVYFSGNHIIDAVLNYEIPYHCSKEAKIVVYGELPEIQTISAMDLCTLFSNLLSNSINSVNGCIGQITPELIIHFQSGTRYFSISISNSICDDIKLPEMSKKAKRKDRNHGFGLYKIKEVLEKYDGRFEQDIKGQVLTIKVYLPI